MKQNAPTPSVTIKIVTSVYIALTVGLLVGGCFSAPTLLVGGLLASIGLYCYLFWAPVAYELADNTLTVFFRASRKRFDGVTRCSLITERLPRLTLRLGGNGGVFAGAGIFWNRRYGIFRAYVTRTKHTELVLVETNRRKIIISPETPGAWLSA